MFLRFRCYSPEFTQNIETDGQHLLYFVVHTKIFFWNGRNEEVNRNKKGVGWINSFFINKLVTYCFYVFFFQRMRKSIRFQMTLFAFNLDIYDEIEMNWNIDEILSLFMIQVMTYLFWRGVRIRKRYLFKLFGNFSIFSYWIMVKTRDIRWFLPAFLKITFHRKSICVSYR